MYVNHLLKTRGKKQNFKETGDSKYIWQNELDKACFEHDMAYGYLKNLPKRTSSDKVLTDKVFNIGVNQKFGL